jgi:4-nitrophenyl phosphatase
MRQLIDKLKDIRLAIFDLDGIIYRGEALIPNVDKVIQDLKDLSIKVTYNSNNSTATREMYVERLKKFNISADITDFYTSASITSAEISKIKKKAKIFVIGEIGLKEELKVMGHSVINVPENYNEIDFVIVGLDRNFNYQNLAIAQKCILEGGAQFYATNADATLPIAKGLLPGAGVMVNAVETCTGKQPIKVFGKPEPTGIKQVLNEYNISPHEACFFGDRLNTDILAGNRAEVITVAVLTGITTKKFMEDIYQKSKVLEYFNNNLLPDLVINNLEEIFLK